MRDRSRRPWASNAEVTECVEAELSCLGGVLLSNQAYDALSGVLTAEDFEPRHGVIWSAMGRLVGKQAPIDATTLAQALDESGDLARVGGVEYLLGLTEAVATAVNIEHHGRIVAKFGAKRRLLAKLDAHRQAILASPIDEVPGVRDAAVADLLGESGEDNATAVDIVTAAREVFEDLKARHANPSEYSGMTCGLHALDAITLGFEDGDLITLGAASGHGKTMAGVFIAAAAARMSRRHSLYVSVEVQASRIARRVMANYSGVDGSKLRTGQMSSEEWIALGESAREIAALKGLMSVSFAPKGNVPMIHREIRRYLLRKPQYPLGLVVVDYLQRLHATEKRRSREEEVADIARALKDLACTYSVPVLALAQLNRDPSKRADKRPVPSDLRESSAMEHESSLLMFLHHPAAWDPAKNPNVAEFVIAKARDGEQGIAEVGIDKARQRFYNLERRYGDFHP